MATKLADDFMHALQETERVGDAGPVVAMFAEDGEALNLGRTEPVRGREGVRRFWEEYLSSFREIRSEFTRVIEGEQGVVLEWVSRGALPDGQPVEYRGVSILEPAEGPVRRFRTYYDSAVFLPLGAKAVHR